MKYQKALGDPATKSGSGVSGKRELNFEKAKKLYKEYNLLNFRT